MAASKVSLKLLIDKKANKVLFAEAEKDFVDFLFNLLSLPLSTVIRLISNEITFGCIGNLYQSFDCMNEAYMQPNLNKDSLLNPRVPSLANNVSLLLPDANLHHTERNIYACRGNCGHASFTKGTICPTCRNSMSQNLVFIDTNNSTASATSEGGYVKDLATYMVTDDLLVSPMSMISGVALLNKFNVKEFGVLEEKVVEFGINEGLEFLKASLQSKAVLTNVFLLKQDINKSTASKLE